MNEKRRCESSERERMGGGGWKKDLLLCPEFYILKKKKKIGEGISKEDRKKEKWSDKLS